MMKIELNNEMLEVYTPYNANFVSMIKGIEGRKWNPDKKCWTVPESEIESVRDIMKDVYGYDDTTQPQEYEENYFSPEYPRWNSGIPEKGEIFERDGKACKCTYMRYDDDLSNTKIKYVDISDTDEGRDFLNRRPLEKEKKEIVKTLQDAARLLNGESKGGYDIPDDIGTHNDAEILWEEKYETGSSKTAIYANDEVAAVLFQSYYDTPIYNYTYKPIAEAGDFVKKIKELVHRLKELE